VTVKLINYNHH